MIPIAILEVHTYAGIVAGASHYSGKIVGTLAEEEKKSPLFKGCKWFVKTPVEHPLTAAEAKQFNKEETYGYKYKRGEISERYFDEAVLHKYAIDLARSIGYEALFRGQSSCCSPQLMLYGPRMEEANAIYQEYEALFEDCYDPPGVEKFEDAWTALLREAGMVDRHIRFTRD